MTVAIKPLNLAELLSQNQELEMNQARMARAQREEDRQMRLSDALGRYKYGTPEYIQELGKFDSNAATGVQNAANIQTANANKLNENFQNDIYKVSAVGKQAIDNGADPAQVTQWAIGQLSQAHPEHAPQLKPDMFLQHLDMNAMRGGYKNPATELQQKKDEWTAKAEIEQQYGKGADPSFTALPTSKGYYNYSRRTGKGNYITDEQGNIVGRADADPELQGRIASAKASGKGLGEAQSTAETNLGKTVDQAEYAKQLLDELVAHPGKSSIVGAPSISNPVAKLYAVPGSDAAGFKTRLEQIQGQNFLQAFQTLKGGGQITEIEGKKATDAIGRMQTAQSEKEFDAAAMELKGIIEQGVQRARQAAGGNFGPAGNPAAADDDDISDLLEKYK